MGQEQLRKTLEQLQTELAHTDSADSTTNELLQGVRRDVAALLDRLDQPSAHGQRSALARLRDAIPYFEGSHPSLTIAMAQVVDTLNRMGL
jgi:septal ring factor EnvC (AmiA/AmiB activator)